MGMRDRIDRAWILWRLFRFWLGEGSFYDAADCLVGAVFELILPSWLNKKLSVFFWAAEAMFGDESFANLHVKLRKLPGGVGFKVWEEWLSNERERRARIWQGGRMI